MKPYGPRDIVKEECVGHVQKRMYSRLMKLKIVMKKQVLSDGKTIGGKKGYQSPLSINSVCIMAMP